MGRSQADAFCPACSRFIGPADTCPYCDADSARKPVLRALRAAAFVLAFGGLAFLYLSAAHREIPLIKASSISPGMNFALVRMSGEVTRSPYIAREKGTANYLSFLLDDDSGQIRVVASGAIAGYLASNERICAGDIVNVIGTLNVSAGSQPKLRLNSTNNLIVAMPPAEKNQTP